MGTEYSKNPGFERDDGLDGYSLESEEYEHIAALLQAHQIPAKGDGLPQTLVARLALLEENFARICTVVGKLEQEILQLKEKELNEPLSPDD